MDPERVVKQLGGVTRRRVLLARGVTRADIDAAVRSGTLNRPMTGVVALPGVPDDWVRACYFGARISCASAVAEHGLRVLEHPRRLHLEIPAHRGGRVTPTVLRENVVLHRCRSHQPGGRIDTIARAIDVMALCETPLAQLVAIDHALGLGHMRRDQISGFTITPLATRRWLENTADAWAGSVPETCARVALRAAGLRVQVQAPLGGGRRADFLVEGLLYVEIDGTSYHSDPAQFAEDRRRDRQIVASGGHVIRFTYADAVHHPERLVADVRASLRAIRA